MKYLRYPKYKESGVEWLGEVPEGWQVCRLKRVGLFKGGCGFPHSQQGQVGLELPFYKVNSLAQANEDGTLSAPADSVSMTTANELGAFIFPANTIVFAKVGAALLLCRIRMLPCPSCIDNNMMGIVVRESNFDRDFLYYLLQLVRFDFIVNPGAVPSINEKDIGDYIVSTPLISGQRAIGAFLNNACRKIYALIAEQEKLITLLKEKRQAVISHAVTKGLNPDAPMNDSGVEWLGMVPKHWTLQTLKHITSQVTVGIVVTPSKYYVEHGVIALRSLNIKSNNIDCSDIVFISNTANQLHEKSILHSNDLVIVRTGQPGTAAIVPPELDGINCIDLIIVRKSNKTLSTYLQYFLSSSNAKRHFESESGGALQQHFNVESARNLHIAFPTLQEQAEIVRYLDAATRDCDRLIVEAENMVLLLHERRTAFISAAITGKIDVRGLASTETA